MPSPFRVPFFLVTLAGLAACMAPGGGEVLDSAGSNSSSAGGWGQPGELDPVTVEVTRTRSATLQSADGRVRVTVPALAVTAAARVVLARVSDGLAPDGPRVGPAYVLRIPTGEVGIPLRVEWRVDPEVTVPLADLRVAVPDPAGNGLVALRGAQVATDLVAAQLNGASMIMLVDRRPLNGSGKAWAADLPATSAGDALLWRGDVEGARAAYHAARLRGPDAKAALGRGLMDLMLTLTERPMSDLSVRCGLGRQALLSALVAPGGVLQQAAADRGGSAALELQDPLGRSTLFANEVYARRHGGVLMATARGDGFELRLKVESRVRPAVRLGVAEFPGSVELDFGGDTYRWSAADRGSVLVYQAGSGSTPGLRVVLEGVTLTGLPGRITVDAELDDEVRAAPDLWATLAASLPGTDGGGMPPLSALLSRCSPDVTVAWLRAAGLELAERLGQSSADLAEAAAASSESVLLSVPPGLTGLPRSLDLTPRDVRVLTALVDGLRGALTLTAGYEVMGGLADGGSRPVQGYVVDGVLHQARADGGFAQVPTRVLSARMVAEEVGRMAFQPAGGDAAALNQRGAQARGLWERALGELRAALASPGSVDGVIRFSTLSERGILFPLQLTVEALLASLPAGSAGVALPGGGGASARLGQFLDAPPTQASLLAANRQEPLAVSFPGAPQGRTAVSRDPRALWHDRGFVSALWNAAVTVPTMPSVDVCQPEVADQCGAGFVCAADELGTCAASQSVCAADVGCPLLESCLLTHRCRRGPPPTLDWGQLAQVVWGPTSDVLQPAVWLVVQPLLGMDPADPEPAERPWAGMVLP